MADVVVNLTMISNDVYKYPVVYPPGVFFMSRVHEKIHVYEHVSGVKMPGNHERFVPR